MQPEPIFSFSPFRTGNSWPLCAQRENVLTLYFTFSLRAGLLKGTIFNLATTLFFHVRIPHVILTLLEAISLASTCFSHSFVTSTPKFIGLFHGSLVERSPIRGIVAEPILGGHQTDKVEKWRFSRPLDRKLYVAEKPKADCLHLNPESRSGNAAAIEVSVC